MNRLATDPHSQGGTVMDDSPYLLRYRADGQIMFNDPRLAQALADTLTEARVLLEADVKPNRTHYVVGVFYAESHILDGMAGANVVGVGTSPGRAVRNALGWHFGSADMAHVAWATNRTFTALHTDELVA